MFGGCGSWAVSPLPPPADRTGGAQPEPERLMPRAGAGMRTCVSHKGRPGHPDCAPGPGIRSCKQSRQSEFEGGGGDPHRPAPWTRHWSAEPPAHGHRGRRGPRATAPHGGVGGGGLSRCVDRLGSLSSLPSPGGQSVPWWRAQLPAGGGTRHGDPDRSVLRALPGSLWTMPTSPGAVLQAKGLPRCLGPWSCDPRPHHAGHRHLPKARLYTSF